MEQPRNRPLGLHCLLYVVADRICMPETGRGDSFTEYLNTSERWLARIAGSVLAGFSDSSTAAHRARVPVPCRPTVQVLKIELASKLLLAALLECRDLGRVELRLAGPRSQRKKLFGLDNRAQVIARPGPALDGLCGQILTRLERKGEQGAHSLFSSLMGTSGMIGGHFGGGWVLEKVETELAGYGYMRPPTERARLAVIRTQRLVGDCQRIQTLEEECAVAVDRWHQVWAADLDLYDALFADCTEAMEPPKGGGGA
jgi:hypothetical protein